MTLSGDASMSYGSPDVVQDAVGILRALNDGDLERANELAEPYEGEDAVRLISALSRFILWVLERVVKSRLPDLGEFAVSAHVAAYLEKLERTANASNN